MACNTLVSTLPPIPSDSAITTKRAVDTADLGRSFQAMNPAAKTPIAAKGRPTRATGTATTYISTKARSNGVSSGMRLPGLRTSTAVTASPPTIVGAQNSEATTASDHRPCFWGDFTKWRSMGKQSNASAEPCRCDTLAQHDGASAPVRCYAALRKHLQRRQMPRAAPPTIPPAAAMNGAMNTRPPMATPPTTEGRPPSATCITLIATTRTTTYVSVDKTNPRKGQSNADAR